MQGSSEIIEGIRFKSPTSLFIVSLIAVFMVINADELLSASKYRSSWGFLGMK